MDSTLLKLILAFLIIAFFIYLCFNKKNENNETNEILINNIENNIENIEVPPKYEEIDN
jgi:YbbR domain-containing protein